MTDTEQWTLAIDYGTTHTCAAVAVDGKDPEILQIEGLNRLPSLVVESGGSLLTGKVARNQLPVDPRKGERTPKRHIGVLETLPIGSGVSVVDAVAAVLRRVLDEARLRFDKSDPAMVVITHPVRWEQTRLDVLRRAAEAAGLPEVSFLPEPVASALHFAAARNVEPGAHVAVYDLGGGTYDTAVLRSGGFGFEVVGVPGGDPNIGGERFDEALLSYVGDQIADVDPDAWTALTAPDAGKSTLMDFLDLRTRVRDAKEALSFDTAAEVHVKALDRSIRITREEFEGLIESDIAETVAEMADTLKAAAIEPKALSALYLTGDSSRIPAIARALHQKFAPLAPTNWDDPKAVVALGATRYASLERDEFQSTETDDEGGAEITGTAAERIATMVGTLGALLEADGAGAAAARLRDAEATIATAGAAIVVVGETKRGKSSLINALVARPGVLPVDVDVATSTFLEVRYAEAPEAKVFTEDKPDGIPIPLAEIGDWGSMAGNPINDKEVTHVQVGLDSPLLAKGLTLIDTPGVGGLVAGHKQITLASLSRADALMLVVDANAPLSEPELSFLAEATDRIETVIVAQTKKDAFPSWEAIAKDNLALIASHAPRYRNAPLVAVASPIKVQADQARAGGDTAFADELDAESGYLTLTQEIDTRVIRRTSALRQGNLCRSMLSAINHQSGKEEQRLRSIQGDPTVAAELAEQQDRCREAKTASAGWRDRLEIDTAELLPKLCREIDAAVDSTLRRAEKQLNNGGVAGLRENAQDMGDALRGHWMDVQRSMGVGMTAVATRLAAQLAADGFALSSSAANSKGGDPFDDMVDESVIAQLEGAGSEAMDKESLWDKPATSGVLLGLGVVTLGWGWFAGAAYTGYRAYKRKQKKEAMGTASTPAAALAYLKSKAEAARQDMQADIENQLADAAEQLTASVGAFIDERDAELVAELSAHQARAAAAETDRAAEEKAVQLRMASLGRIGSAATTLLGELTAAPAATN